MGGTERKRRWGDEAMRETKLDRAAEASPHRPLAPPPARPPAPHSCGTEPASSLHSPQPAVDLQRRGGRPAGFRHLPLPASAPSGGLRIRSSTDGVRHLALSALTRARAPVMYRL